MASLTQRTSGKAGRATGTAERNRGISLIRQWMVVTSLPVGGAGRRVDEIAERVECSGRTVYRDLKVLEAAGFPVRRERTARGTVCGLPAGFRDFPPLPFSQVDAAALVVAERRLRAAGEEFFADQLSAVLSRLAKGRGEAVEALVERLEGSFVGMGGRLATVPKGSGHGGDARGGWYELVASAIQRGEVLSIDYHDPKDRKSSDRQVLPLALSIVESRTQLQAWCLMRQGLRTFVMSRIEAISGTGELMARPEGVDAEAVAAESFAGFHGEPVEVALEFEGGLERHLRESPLFLGATEMARNSHGWVEMRLRTGVTDALVHRLLSYGASVRVVAPEALRERVAREHREAWEAQSGGVEAERGPGRALLLAPL